MLASRTLESKWEILLCVITPVCSPGILNLSVLDSFFSVVHRLGGGRICICCVAMIKEKSRLEQNLTGLKEFGLKTIK